MIGSFEAAALTPEQHDMIREFVSRRGGSLLMLGGRRGLTDGGWGATSVAEVLPVRLPELDGPSFVREPAKAVLAPAGRTSALTRLDADDEANEAAWAELPDLADFQTLGERKPGAETLLEAEFDGRTEPLLVHAALRPRQRVRARDGRHVALADAAAARGSTARDVLAAAAAGRGHDGAAARHSDVGAGVLRRREHRAAARRSPRQDLPACERRDRDARGQRRAGPADDGRDDARRRRARRLRSRLRDDAHRRVPLRGGGQDRATRSSAARASPCAARTASSSTTACSRTGRCSSGSRPRPAAPTSPSATSSRLPEAVSFSEAGSVERQVLDLWNMPIAFLLLLLLKAGEWLVRLYWGRL